MSKIVKFLIDSPDSKDSSFNTMYYFDSYSPFKIHARYSSSLTIWFTKTILESTRKIGYTFPMKAFFSLIVVGLIICAWCPWIDPAEAEQLIYNRVYKSQSTLQNGCNLSIVPGSFEKVPFGYRQTVGYNCTFTNEFVTDGTNNVFLTFYKDVLNVPHPIIK